MVESACPFSTKGEMRMAGTRIPRRVKSKGGCLDFFHPGWVPDRAAEHDRQNLKEEFELLARTPTLILEKCTD